MLSQQLCKHRWSSTDTDRRITRKMFCAGLDLGGKDACNVNKSFDHSIITMHAYVKLDSGGGAIMQSPETGRYEIVGLVSWGDRRCGAPVKPGVYARTNNRGR